MMTDTHRPHPTTRVCTLCGYDGLFIENLSCAFLRRVPPAVIEHHLQRLEPSAANATPVPAPISPANEMLDDPSDVTAEESTIYQHYRCPRCRSEWVATGTKPNHPNWGGDECLHCETKGKPIEGDE